MVWTQERRQKHSKISKERGFGLWMTGKKISERTRQKMSTSQKQSYKDTDRTGSWKGKSRKGLITPEGRKRISEARRGKKLSEEHRRKLSESHKGNPGYWTGKVGPIRSEETRKKMHDSHKAHPERHWSWQGGRTPENLKIRHSLEYKQWRTAVFRRDNFTCQLCGQHGGTLNADHIKPFSKFPDLRLELSNGRTLCEPCHRGTGTYGYKSRVKK